MEVYRLSALRNRWKPAGALGPDGVVIPQNIITKAPTAELRENQKDQDSLPPYEVLDDILEAWSRTRCACREIVARGPRPRDGEEGRAPALSRRIQAPAGRARREGDAARISAATGAIRSSTASAIPASRPAQPDAVAGGAAHREIDALTSAGSSDEPLPSSASPRRPPAASISAMPAPALLNCAVRRARAAARSCCGSTTPTSSARREEYRARHRRGPRLARHRARRVRAPVGAHRALRRGRRAAAGGRAALPLLRDRGRARPPPQAAARARAAAGLRPRRAEADGRATAPRWRPRAARRIGASCSSTHGGLGRPRARRHATSTAPRCPIPCWCARTAATSTRCPRWSTTSTSASPHVIRGEDHVTNTGGADPDLRGAGRGAARVRAPQPADHGERRGAVEAARPSLAARAARSGHRAARRGGARRAGRLGRGGAPRRQPRRTRRTGRPRPSSRARRRGSTRPNSRASTRKLAAPPAL